MALTDEQVERYARHLILKGVGVKGQKRLLASSVLIIGAGGLGSPAALYLAAAGVGHIGLVDGDVVDMSNLQRQIIHTTARVGAPKVESAATAIRALNPDVTVDTYYELVDASNIAGLIEPYDLVIDATDNFAAKFLINDACVLAGKPYIHAGVVGFAGQVMTVIPGEGPCYRCIFRDLPAAGNFLRLARSMRAGTMTDQMVAARPAHPMAARKPSGLMSPPSRGGRKVTRVVLALPMTESSNLHRSAM